MSDLGTGQKLLEWITLGLAIVFIIMGIGVVWGVFFPERIFLDYNMRMVIGFILIGYGLVRIVMISRRMRSQKRRNPFAKNP